MDISLFSSPLSSALSPKASKAERRDFHHATLTRRNFEQRPSDQATMADRTSEDDLRKVSALASLLVVFGHPTQPNNPSANPQSTCAWPRGATTGLDFTI